MMPKPRQRRTSHPRPNASRLPLWILAVLLAAAALSWPPTATADTSSEIGAILARHQIDTSATGVFVWDLDAARPVYTWNDDEEFAPASNMKLVTSAAALMNWGADHRLATELYLPDVRITDGVLPGDLYLRGLGDPSLSTRDYQRQDLGFSTASLEAFVRGLRARGVHTISGRVLGDESWFDDERTVSTWKPGLETQCGPLSALSGNGGVHDDQRVDSPATYSAQLLTTALRKAGITIEGRPGTGEAPAEAKLLQQQSSAPLRVLLRHMNKESDNLFAEVLLKGLGRDFQDLGATSVGTLLSAATLASVGAPSDTYVVQDGSGLSYGNRLTPYVIVQLLGAMRQRPDFDVFYDSLAIAGKDGTLAERMRGTAAAENARAKTGTLNVATSLSGYVTSANGHLVAFSILMAGDPLDWVNSTGAQDKIVAALAETRLPGKRQLRVTPGLRQAVASSVTAGHTAGRALRPGVQP